MRNTGSADSGGGAGAQVDSIEVVLGLHWDPPQEGVGAIPADLDALCVLLDAQGGMLEVVHPGRTRASNDSVIHTGDSRTGASAWDDERIFVFLEALPPAVCALAFVVISANGRAFHEARGAFCHLSDRLDERVWLRLDLTTLTDCSILTVALLRRVASGWNISAEAPVAQADLLADLRTLLSGAKRGHG